LLLALPLGCFAQETPQPLREMQAIADMERKGALSFVNNKEQTQSSNNFDVHYYRCEWQVDPNVWYIKGIVTSSFTILSSTNNIIFDCSDQLTIDSVMYHGSVITFQRDQPGAVTIQFPSTIAANTLDSVSIFYQGSPINGGYRAFHQFANYRGSAAIWTLSEPYGASEWWPCKNNLADKADSIDICITHPSAYTASSNGVLQWEQNVDSTTVTDYFKHRHPIATYLVAIALTKYALKSDSVLIGNTQMPVLMYSFTFDTAYYLPATAVVKQCLQKFSELWGDYPFKDEHYSQTQWGLSGGMEHQTNSFIIDRWPSMVSHELGHQWFGDRVTTGSWADIWLNEGFATFTTNVYYEFFQPDLLQPTLQAYINSITSVPNGSVYVNDTTSVGRIFSNRLSYYKGSYVVQMLRWKLGDSLFFKGLRQYLSDPKVSFGFATTADLQRNLEQVSGMNLGSFFQKWIYGQGYPNYQATWSQNKNNWALLTLNQTTSDPSVNFYEMPVAIQFKNATQSKSFRVDHQNSGQQFWLDVGFVADTVIIDPDLWLLAKTKTSLKVNTDAGQADDLSIYPNPAPGNLTVSLKNPTSPTLWIQLYNSIGQLVFSRQVQTPGRDELIKISLSSMARGTY